MRSTILFIQRTKITNVWYNETKDYNSNKPKFTFNTGYFTQIVWNNQGGNSGLEVQNSIIDSINTTDQYLASKLNYPETLRVLNLRNLRIRGSDCSCLEQLMGKFTNTVEEFSLCLTHYCTDEVDVCFNGHRLATLCSRLPRLRSLHFAIHLQFIERRRTQTLTDFAQTFRTPFWLDGPLGRIQVCMTYDQVFNFVQMLSLPYTFSDNILFYTIDLIDVLFNNSEEEKERPNNLSIALRPL
ncbi:unnamed protein product [Rotaria magnacalcarata]